MPKIISVIQFEGSPDQIVWKSPVEDFNSATQLIVDETHEAIVLIEGKTELYGPGRHTLRTENYFGLNKIQKLATGGDTPFPCKVFFVNKIHSLDMQWGTQDALVVEDPKLEIILHLKLHGNLTYVVENSLKFVEKFTGFTRDFRPEETIAKFRGIISTEVSDCVTKIVNVARIDYLDINAHLKEISQLLLEPISSYFEEYGARLVYFNMETITSREDDLAEVQSAKSAARARVITATSEAQAREIQGYDWLAEKKADILQALAGNDGSMGGMMGAGIGVMAMGPMGQNLTSVVDDMFNPDMMKRGQADPFAEKTGATTSGMKPFGLQESQTVEQSGHVDVRNIFSQQADGGIASSIGGTSTEVMDSISEPMSAAVPQGSLSERSKPLSKEEFMAKIADLKDFLKMGIINQSEFDASKKELLQRFNKN